jgi:DedD protein
MDRRVKERLVGASILVLLIVLIVPELLSGPAPGPVSPKLPVSAPEPVRNVTVDLATSKAPIPEPPAEAEPASSAQAPEAHSGGAASAAADPAPALPAVPAAPVPPKASPTPLETPPQPPTSAATAAKPPAGQNWAVQLGSFASHANAEKLVHQLKSQGFPVYVLSGGSGASARYRVRVGPMADRGSATQALAKLKAAGHAGALVSPGP